MTAHSRMVLKIAPWKFWQCFYMGAAGPSAQPCSGHLIDQGEIGVDVSTANEEKLEPDPPPLTERGHKVMVASVMLVMPSPQATPAGS